MDQKTSAAPIRVMRRTSLIAYKELVQDGKLPARKREVYDALYNYGPMTANELKAQMVKCGLPPLIVADAHKRLSELRRFGFVKECGERTCRVTGNSVVEWDCTDRIEPISEAAVAG